MELGVNPATKISYLDGRPTTLTLRRCKLALKRGSELKEYTFDQDVVGIGAMEDNDLVVDDATVSRNHCKIFREGDQYMISDLGSTNGTFVDGVRVREAWLHEGCTFSLGETDVLFQPIDEQVRIIPSDRERYGEIIGRDRSMREIYAILEKISPTDTTVVIEGETGTGKEVVARTLHNQSRRREGPFVVFDCGAVAENLIESELFGHEKGSFTGASSTRHGIFEMAQGGTVFLDELGELQLDLQPKLLRVLEQREVRRVGGSKPLKVDVRIVAATNRNLEDEVRAGRFREDLFYRLTVVRLMLPALCKRGEDISLLAGHFLNQGRFNQKADGGRKVTSFSPEAMQRLLQYEWPGNVRELHNVVERAVSFADHDSVQLQDLPKHIAYPSGGPGQGVSLPGAGGGTAGDTNPSIVLPALSPEELGTFKDAKEQWVSSFEGDYILALLRKNKGNISHAAREADIDRKYFRKLMKKYTLSPDDLG